MTIRTKFASRHAFTGRTRPSIGVFAWFRTFASIWRERQSLESLDDHILKDIGKSRDEVRAEARRPAWDAPNRWLR